MIDIVGKIGSMALINKELDNIDEDIFAKICWRLKPGMVWVSSGAVEIGMRDYIARNGKEVDASSEAAKTDYAAQGQATLMQMYRKHIAPEYSVRQVLVEHNHFNNDVKREHIRELLLRAASQRAVPIVNYNDAVSVEESRKMEIQSVKNKKGSVVELVDNDETASQIACMVNAKVLLILSTLEGIYADINDKNSLIKEVSASSYSSVEKKLDLMREACSGASRAGANGANAKLDYIKPCLAQGMKVIIASAKYDIQDIVTSKVPSTMIYIK